MTDQDDERAAMLAFTIWAGAITAGEALKTGQSWLSTEQLLERGWRAAWQARGEYERARGAAAESENARVMEIAEIVRSRAVLLNCGCDDHALQDEILEYLGQTLGPFPGDLAVVPVATARARAETRHEPWCAVSGGECSCDAPEFGPHD